MLNQNVKIVRANSKNCAAIVFFRPILSSTKIVTKMPTKTSVNRFINAIFLYITLGTTSPAN